MKWKTCYTLLIFHFLCSMLASVSSLAVWLTGKRKRRLCLGLINFSRERHEEGNQPRAAKLSDCTVKDLSQIFAGSWIGMIGIRLGRQSVTARLYSRSRQPAELLDFSFSNEPRLERDMSAQPGPSPTTSQTLPVLSFLIQSGPTFRAQQSCMKSRGLSGFLLNLSFATVYGEHWRSDQNYQVSRLQRGAASEVGATLPPGNYLLFQCCYILMPILGGKAISSRI